MLRLAWRKIASLRPRATDPAGPRRRDADPARRTRSCDAATIGFGIRNVAEPARALAELARVLAPGGRLAILEFGQPRIPGSGRSTRWYFRYLLPLVGRLVSQHQSAYSYLPASVGTFPPPAEFARTYRKSRICHRSGPSR